MLKLYDYLDEVLAIEKVAQMRRHQKLDYYASELMVRMSDTSEEDFKETLLRTFKICGALEISIGENFKKVYRYDGQKLITDWQLSPLGCYLFLLNGNPTNPSVAKMQLFAALKSKK